MKLQQLRFVVAVAQNQLNVTTAALKLATTQPAVSKQLKLLEVELGVKIFERAGRSLTQITPAGERVVSYATQVLRDVQNIKSVSEEFKDDRAGTLSIGTTHTQARYLLPPVIQQFRSRYPKVQLHLHQGTVEQIAEMSQLGRIDLAIATGSRELFKSCLVLPCYQWRRQIVVPGQHPLAQFKKPTLRQLARYPILAYQFSWDDPSLLGETFRGTGRRPHVALTARDSDVIKTYVRLGLGVGIIASVAVQRGSDADLTLIDTAHLFPAHTTWIGFARSRLLRRFVYDFIQLTAPHLTRAFIERALAVNADDLELLVSELRLPVR